MGADVRCRVTLWAINMEELKAVMHDENGHDRWSSADQQIPAKIPDEKSYSTETARRNT
ncbi:MAG: hypothetical protein ACLTXL_09690 [Clostridia bacterium]